MSSGDPAGQAPGEIPIPPVAAQTPDSREVARVWIANGGCHVTLWSAFEDPAMWGMLIADLARHAARSTAADKICSEKEALQAIVTYFNREMEQPTDIGTTEDIKRQ